MKDGHVLIDPFGDEAGRLLGQIYPAISELIGDFAADLHHQYAASQEALDVLARLLPEERERLNKEHADHLLMLLAPDTERSTLLSEAEKAGWHHTFIGVDLRWVFRAIYSLKRRVLEQITSQIADNRTREALYGVIEERLDLGIDGEMGGYREYSVESDRMFSRFNEHLISAGNYTDIIRGALQLLCDSPGEVGALYSRPDKNGELRVEEYAGAIGEKYYLALEAGDSVNMSTISEKAAGKGPGGRAWRSGEIQVTDAWMLDPSLAPWHPLGKKLGIRASAGIPLLDNRGRSIALLGLYSAYPGFFSNFHIRGFLSHIQVALSGTLQRMAAHPVVPVRSQRAYRVLLAEKSVTLHYQPIVDLQTGELTKLEALARLVDAEGQVIQPDTFIPTFGRSELYELFAQGLDIICKDIPYRDSIGINVPVAFNFPAEGFGDGRYEQLLQEALSDQRVPADRIHLELLETKESSEVLSSRHAFLTRVREFGIHIIQDDLGSGHSSLLRLDQYPFDEVKIDQGLVRGALNTPKRVVEFILYLTRLSHAFGLPVTVEGLENDGLIEAAIILGADQGQGYGIARPMPIDAVSNWAGSFSLDLSADAPTTAMGALATYLLWDIQRVESDGDGHHQQDPLAAIQGYIAKRHSKGSELDQVFNGTNTHTSSGSVPVIEALTRAWLDEIENQQG